MKTAGAGLQSHIAQQSTTLATLWKITPRVGSAIGFTDHDADITYSGLTYQAESSAYRPTTIETSAGASVDNLDAELILSSSGITDAAVRAGYYDGATVEMMLCNWSDISQGVVVLRKGVIGDVSLRSSGIAKAELRGMLQYLQQQVGRVHTRRCNADLGDTRCGVTLATYTVTGTVSSVTTARIKFVVSTAPTRALGKLTWTSGLNNGLSMEVVTVSGSTLTLSQPMPYDIAASDGYSVYAGCDKNPSTCRTVFANLNRFRGFPFLPTLDQVARTPDAH